MVTIGICDDDAVLTAQLKQQVKNAFLAHGVTTKIEVFGIADDFLNALNEVYYDIIFLDIEIGDASGIELGCKLRELLNNSSTIIVFITSYEKYHLEYSAYAASPTAFLVKPIQDTKLYKVVDTITKRFENKMKDPDIFPYSFGTDNYSIQLSDILYFQGNLRTKYIVFKDNKLPLNSSMANIVKCVDGKDFILVSRSFLVNAHHIVHYSKTEVIMRNGVHIQFSVRRQKKAMEEIIKFFSREESTCLL